MSENQNNEKGGSKDHFGLPGGYFESSAGKIREKIFWDEEHREFPLLVARRSESGFSVPAQYFETSRLVLEHAEFPVLTKAGRKNAFEVPADYFELAAARIQSALLRGERVADSGRSAKIISIRSQRLVFAMAAMLLLVLSMWLYSYYFAPAAIEDCGTIACVDKTELVKSKSLEMLEEDDLFEIVNTTELEKKLENSGVPANRRPVKDSSLDEQAGDELLDDI
jgi:hypothetical protein